MKNSTPSKSLLFAAALVVGCGLFAAEVEARVTRNLGWTIRWTSGQMTARHRQMKRKLLIYRNTRERRCRTAAYCGTRHRLLSIVGTIVSYETKWYREDGPRPDFGTRYTAVDLDQWGRPATLDWVFGQRPVLRALLGERLIRRALAARRPRSFSDLFTKLDGGCKTHMSRQLLSQFAFYQVKQGMAWVRVGLSHGCPSHAGTFTTFTLRLPLPARLSRRVRRARKARLLMRNLAPEPPRPMR